MDPAMSILRSRAPTEEIDFGFVMDCLKNYSFVRSKISQLLKKHALVRIKKGIYVFGSLFSRRPYSLETLANIMYGPSYVSLEWVLAAHGMIPERVEEITSVTTKRSRMFTTPLGRFSFEHRPIFAYSLGVVRCQISEYQSYLIATPEKALVDLLIIRRGRLSGLSELKEVLFEDFRIEEEDLHKLDVTLIKKINDAYPHSTISHLLHLLSKVKT